MCRAQSNIHGTVPEKNLRIEVFSLHTQCQQCLQFNLSGTTAEPENSDNPKNGATLMYIYKSPVG